MDVAPPAPNGEPPRRRIDTNVLLQQAMQLYRDSKGVTMTPFLPLLFNLRGQPYTIEDHFHFSPLFRTRVPKKTVLMTARQVTKSTTGSSRSILRAATIPHYSLLYVTPLYEQVRKISTNYVKDFIEQSPVKHILMDKKSLNSVLQRTFRNNSKLMFNFAYTDANRIRGTTADETVYDEVQNMLKENIGIIDEVMSHSKYHISSFFGTPLTYDNILSRFFDDSSGGEWVVRCPACNHYNIPSLQYDLLKMIGPWRPDISEEKPGLICAGCARPLNPRPPNGRWIHAREKRRWDFVGYHVPQMILPLHYADRDAWRDILRKQHGLPPYMFANEVCGEPASTGERLVSEGDLRAACILGTPNTEAAAKARLERYTHTILTVDWGGGGEQWRSWTVLALLGLRPDGVIECPWAYRSLMPHEHVEEARLVLIALARFGCTHLVHDYGGAGAIRETLIVHAGFPEERVMPMVYSGTLGASTIREHPASPVVPRRYYGLAKTKALQLVCNQIKLKQLLFFDYDRGDDTNPGLLGDFLSLMEETHRSKSGRNQYVVATDVSSPDDFAQAVTMGCCGLWEITGRWPSLADKVGMELPQELMRQLRPDDYDEMVGPGYTPWG